MTKIFRRHNAMAIVSPSNPSIRLPFQRKLTALGAIMHLAHGSSLLCAALDIHCHGPGEITGVNQG